MGVTDDGFDAKMKAVMAGIARPVRIAAAVSGGPDSMAMTWLLSRWAARQDVEVLAITVDHALRPESAEEAAAVKSQVAGWPKVTHETIVWSGEKPATKILEEARAARYALIARAMKKHGIEHLFVAHHEEDQAETFLTRLSKGSGLDGLSGMRARQAFGDGLTILRPLLGVSKDDLLDVCRTHDIPYVLDPTNANEAYLRPRLRAAQDVLGKEGLSAKRLSVTARRLARASSALRHLADRLSEEALEEESEGVRLYDLDLLKSAPEELAIRVIAAAIGDLGHTETGDYPVRMERIERLCDRILYDDTFKGATLGGCKVSLAEKGSRLKVERE